MECLNDFFKSNAEKSLVALEEEVKICLKFQCDKIQRQEENIARLKKEEETKSDLLKDFVKIKVKLILRENHIVNLLNNQASHEEILDYMTRPTIDELLKAANSNGQDLKTNRFDYHKISMTSLIKYIDDDLW